MTLLLGLSTTNEISIKFMSKGNRSSRPIASMLRVISVPSTGLVFQAYDVAIATSMNASDVPHSLVDIFSA